MSRRLKVYDEDNNFVGEWIGDFVEESKESVSESFDVSFGEGCLALLILLAFKFPWLILVIILWLILKLMWFFIKLICRCIWWVVRLPFTLIFKKEFPVW